MRRSIGSAGRAEAGRRRYNCKPKSEKVGTDKSTWEHLTKSSKGSGLGPFLFNVFINDLIIFIINCLQCNYADDNMISSLKKDNNVVIHSLNTEAL